MGPTTSVVVCAVPRCGSSLLTTLLESAGAGRPAEYFLRGDITSNKKEWGVSSPREYVEGVLRAGTSSNGVFAMKLMWGHLNDLFVYLRAYTRDYESGDLEVFQEVFPNPRFVWIRRKDVIGQAVSWLKAIQTGQYAAWQEAASEPDYSFEQIDSLVTGIRVYEGNWRRWFEAMQIDPIIVGYADLCADHEGVTLGVLDAVGVEPIVDARIAPWDRLTKQADEISAEWITRYEDDRRARHP